MAACTHAACALAHALMQGIEDLDRRVSELQESSRLHWERISSVVAQVEAMQLHYKTTGEGTAFAHDPW